MERYLKYKHLKVTEARLKILEILKNASKPLLAEEIYELVKKEMDINISTIYRNLSTLSEKEIILKSINLDNTSYYQLNNDHHCHQLVCSICKKTVAIDSCPIDELKESLEKKSKYKIIGHSLEFIGICPDCQKLIEQGRIS